jgi:hypothetical protein
MASQPKLGLWSEQRPGTRCSSPARLAAIGATSVLRINLIGGLIRDLILCIGILAGLFVSSGCDKPDVRDLKSILEDYEFYR